MFIIIPLIYPPPNGNLSILKKLIDGYKFWQECVKHFPKTSRHNLGGKIDNIFCEVIELAYTAAISAKEHKLSLINRSISKLNLLIFFLQLAWEVKAIDSKKYQNISLILNEIGRMLGGWRNKIQKETSATK